MTPPFSAKTGLATPSDGSLPSVAQVARLSVDLSNAGVTPAKECNGSSSTRVHDRTQCEVFPQHENASTFRSNEQGHDGLSQSEKSHHDTQTLPCRNALERTSDFTDHRPPIVKSESNASSSTASSSEDSAHNVLQSAQRLCGIQYTDEEIARLMSQPEEVERQIYSITSEGGISSVTRLIHYFGGTETITTRHKFKGFDSLEAMAPLEHQLAWWDHRFSCAHYDCHCSELHYIARDNYPIDAPPGTNQHCHFCLLCLSNEEHADDDMTGIFYPKSIMSRPFAAYPPEAPNELMFRGKRYQVTGLGGHNSMEFNCYSCPDCGHEYSTQQFLYNPARYPHVLFFHPTRTFRKITFVPYIDPDILNPVSTTLRPDTLLDAVGITDPIVRNLFMKFINKYGFLSQFSGTGDTHPQIARFFLTCGQETQFGKLVCLDHHNDVIFTRTQPEQLLFLLCCSHERVNLVIYEETNPTEAINDFQHAYRNCSSVAKTIVADTMSKLLRVCSTREEKTLISNSPKLKPPTSSFHKFAYTTSYMLVGYMAFVLVQPVDSAIPVRMSPPPQEAHSPTSSNSDETMRWLLYVTLIWKVIEFFIQSRLVKTIGRRITATLDGMLRKDPVHQKFKKAYDEAKQCLYEPSAHAEGTEASGATPARSDEPNQESSYGTPADDSKPNEIQFEKDSASETAATTGTEESDEDNPLSGFDKNWTKMITEIDKSPSNQIFKAFRIYGIYLMVLLVEIFWYPLTTSFGAGTTAALSFVLYYHQHFPTVFVVQAIISWSLVTFFKCSTKIVDRVKTEESDSWIIKLSWLVIARSMDSNTYSQGLPLKVPLMVAWIVMTPFPVLCLMIPSIVSVGMEFLYEWHNSGYSETEIREREKEWLESQDMVLDTETVLVNEPSLDSMTSASIEKPRDLPKVIQLIAGPGNSIRSLEDDSTIVTTTNSSLGPVFNVLCGSNTPKAVIIFVVGVLNGPSIKETSLARVTTHHLMNFSSLVSALSTANPKRAKLIFTQLSQLIGVYFAESDKPVLDEDKTHSWMTKVAEGMDYLSSFEDAPFTKTLGEFLGFMVSLPILFHDFVTADSYIKMWKATVKTISKTGMSLSTVIKGMLGMQTIVVASSTSPTPCATLLEMFKGNSVTVEFVECKAILRTITEGTFDFAKGDVHAFRNRLLKLRTNLEKACKRRSSTSVDAARLDSVNLMVEDVTRFLKNAQSRMVPYTIAIHGMPGIGKSVIVNQITQMIHHHMGIADIKKVSYVKLTDAHDNTTDNATTCIILDDQGNIKPEMRKQTLGGALLDINQPFFVQVNKADLPSKGRHFYSQAITILVDNTQERGVSSELMCPLAGMRRFGDQWELKLKPEYATNGMFDPKKIDGRSIGFGENFFFRKVKYIQDGENTPARSIEVIPWCEHVEFFHHLREDVLQHVSKEKERMAREENHKSMIICTKCKELPSAVCGCGQEYFDPTPTPSDEVDKPNLAEWDFGDFSFEALDLTSFEAPTHFVAAMKLRMVCYLRFLVLGDGRLSYLIDFLITHSVIQFCLLGLISLGISNLWDNGISLFPVVSIVFLSSLLWLVDQLIDQWRRVVHHTTTDLVRMNVVTMQRLGTAAAAVTITCIAALVTKGIWDSTFSYFMSSNVAEGGPTQAGSVISPSKVDEEPETVEVVPLEKKEKPKPWVAPLRIPPMANHEANTITELDIASKVGDNNYKIQIVLEDGTDTNNFGLLVCEDMMMFPSHLIWNGTKYMSFKMNVYDHRRSKEHPIFHTIVVQKPFIFCVNQVDACVIWLPNRSLGTHQDLRKYIAKTVGVGAASYQHILRDLNDPSRMISGGMHTMKSEGILCSDTYECRGYSIKNKCLIKLSTQSPSRGGHCGSIYTRTQAPRTIAAMHVAGNQYNKAFAVPITIDMINEAEQYFHDHAFRLSPVIRTKRPDKILDVVVQVQNAPNLTHPVYFLPDDGRLVEIEGEVPSNFKPRSKLAYNPNVDIAIRYLGAKLVKDKPLMRWRLSAHEVLLPATENKPMGNAEHLTAAVKMLHKRIQGAAKKFAEKYEGIIDCTTPLTIQEALNGIDGTPVNCIKRNTAPGFPARGTKGDYIYEINGELVPARCLVDSLIEAVRRLEAGEDPCQDAAGCLKDEAVKRVNGKPKNSRYFYPGPLVQHILCICNLLLQVTVMNENPELFGTAIGKNREGEDWQETVKIFAHPEFRNNCADTDFVKFDCNQQPLLRAAASTVFVEIAKEFGWAHQDIQMLERILSSLLTPTVNLGGTFVKMWNLLLSGFLITAHLNGLVTMVLRRADHARFWEGKDVKKIFREFELQRKSRGKDVSYYVLAAMGFADYDENQGDTTLGDDTVLCCSDFMRFAGWTPNHFRVTCAEWGLEVTSAAKTPHIEFKTFDDCEFLKSYVNYQEDIGMNVSVIGPKSYFQPFITNIRGKDWDPIVYYADQCENCLRSAFFGGRKCFDEIHKRLTAYFEKIPDRALPLILHKTYDEWVEEHKLEVFQEPLTTITQRGQHLLDEYDALIGLEIERPNVAEGEDGDLNKEGTSEDKVEEVIYQADADATVKEGETHPQMAASRMPVEPETNQKSVLDRRILLNVYVWDSSFTPQNFPPHLAMLSQALFKNRLEYIANLSFDVKLTFEITSPASVCGAIMVSQYFSPELASLNTGNTIGAILGASQRPHLILDAGSEDEIYEMIVPYVHYAPFMHIADPQWEHMCTIGMIELAPLASAISPTPPSITMKIYGEFVNFKDTGATHIPRAANPFRAEGGPSEKFSDKMSAASSMLRQVSRVPGLNAMAMPAAVAEAGAGIAHYFGFSRPIKVDANKTTPSTTPGFANMQGELGGGVVSPDPNQATAVSGEVSGFPPDELQIANFAQKWSLFDQFTFSSSSIYRDTLYECNVTPAVFRDVGISDIQPAGCGVPCLFFKFWRGSVHYYFKFHAPKAIAGRVMIYYEPLMTNHTRDPFANTTNFIQEDFNESVNVDFANNRETEIHVGYTSGEPALITLPTSTIPKTHTAISNHITTLQSSLTIGNDIVDVGNITSHWKFPEMGSTTHHNGRIVVAVQSPLTTASGKEFTITCDVWVKAGSDCEFGCYRGAMPQGLFTYVHDDFTDQPTVLDQGGVNDYCTVAPDDTCVAAEGTTPPNTVTPLLPTVAPVGTTAPGPTLVPAPTTTGDPAPPKDTPGPSSAVTPSPAPVLQPTPTTVNPSTNGPISVMPTTTLPTTVEPSTTGPTTQIPASIPPSTVSPTTVGPTTVAPSTFGPTTLAPITEQPTTMQPTTVGPTTVGPTTTAPSTLVPTTAAPVSAAPTTPAPTPLFTQNGLCGVVACNETTLSRMSIVYNDVNALTGTLRADSIDATQFFINVPSYLDTDGYFRTIITNDQLGGTWWVDPEATIPLPVFQTLVSETPGMASTYHMFNHLIKAGERSASTQIEFVEAYMSLPNFSKWHERAAQGSAYAWTTVSLHDNYPLGDQVYMETWTGPLNARMYQVGDVYNVAELGQMLIDQGITEMFYAVDFKGTVILSTSLETKTVTSTRINRVFIRAAPIDSLSIDPTNGWIRCVGHLDYVDNPVGRNVGFEDIPVRRGLTERFAEALFPKNVAESGPSEEKKVYKLGSHNPPDDYFSKVLIGEVIVSFRELLKIPGYVHGMGLLPPPNGKLHSATFMSELYTDRGSAHTESLYAYMLNCFCGVKGGIVNHYHIIGNGVVEVSKNTVNSSSFDVDHVLTGREIIDSRVNPHGCVKFPCQGRLEYYPAQHFTAGVTHSKIVTIHSWDNGYMKVNIYRSTAEDYNLINYRGPALVTIQPVR